MEQFPADVVVVLLELPFVEFVVFDELLELPFVEFPDVSFVELVTLI